ncbi:hypothetical protein V7S43_017883 [Phytophthora oleae]|uniref:Elicitin n=1 Tax=Phytophthora oleae TaxID=2107226 RepID=A0ABD3ERX8_9STRA
MCGSSCATQLQTLASDIPDCYYDYESSNKKASLLEQIDDCTGPNHVNYISTTVFLSSTSAQSDASRAILSFNQAFALALLIAGMLL